MNKLVIIRGLPGSGKSTYARTVFLSEPGRPSVHLETDMYFIKNKKYVFDGSQLKKAHQWCFKSVEVFLNQGYNVVVSNTFTQKWEFEEYIRLAEKLDIECDVLRCTGEYGSVHGVPEDVMERMKERFEDYPGEKLV